MKWRKLGRIFVGNAQSDWVHSHGIVPIARPIDEYLYRIYFSPRDKFGRSNVSWLDIDIRNPTQVLRRSDEPLLKPGPVGNFDDRGVMGCWIVEDGGREILYYQGWMVGVTVPFYVAVGAAVRPAGNPDIPFERCFLGPILDRRPNEPVFIADPAVLLENGVWRMWYQSGKAWTPGAPPLPSYNIRYAESEDGFDWQLNSIEAVTFAHPGEVAIARFCPLKEADGTYRAWYSYRGNDWGYHIGTATSPNGMLWSREDDRVGIYCDSDSWEASMICYPFVFDTPQGRFMLYNGGRYGDQGFGIAILE
ncbi:glycoside hydrolase family protein [Microvirga roseola]|uniref:hypothetical protein n=1 Tax=Microvirga roseola TaxID=2883126 RepID=UPI001E390263|nr:hypothetical protein [Microvirga roseola]